MLTMIQHPPSTLRLLEKLQTWYVQYILITLIITKSYNLSGVVQKWLFLMFGIMDIQQHLYDKV